MSHIIAPKDYLGTENARNKANAALYVRLMDLAFGPGTQTFIGHHLSFQHQADLATENEVPAADTLLFDHDVMRAVFGEHAVDVMIELAKLPVLDRDKALEVYLDHVVNEEPAVPADHGVYVLSDEQPKATGVIGGAPMYDATSGRYTVL